MDKGTNSSGWVPNVVPSKSRGATPTMDMSWPFTVIVWPMTDGLAPKRACQKA